MFWNPGSTDVEIYVTSAILVLVFCINSTFSLLRYRLKGELQCNANTCQSSKSRSVQNGIKNTADTRSTTTEQCEVLREDINKLEREAEALNSPNTFVDYAKAQREITKKKRLLDSLCRQEVWLFYFVFFFVYIFFLGRTAVIRNIARRGIRSWL